MTAIHSLKTVAVFVIGVASGLGAAHQFRIFDAEPVKLTAPAVAPPVSAAKTLTETMPMRAPDTATAPATVSQAVADSSSASAAARATDAPVPFTPAVSSTARSAAPDMKAPDRVETLAAAADPTPEELAQAPMPDSGSVARLSADDAEKLESELRSGVERGAAAPAPADGEAGLLSHERL